MTIHNLLGIGVESSQGERTMFNESNTKATDLKDISCIIVDEFFTIPKELMISFVSYLKNFPLLKIYILGDIQQNGYISNGFHYDYSKCDFLGELVDWKVINKEIVLGKCRFQNTDTIELLNYHRENHCLPVGTMFNEVDENLLINICFTNRKRFEINKRLSIDTRNIEKKYNRYKNNLIISVGDHAILTYNTGEFFKGHLFIVESVGDGLVNGLFKIGNVELGYCITSHRFQGKTINEKANVYEYSKMTRENQYNVLSRFTNKSLICMDEYNFNKSRSEYSAFGTHEVNGSGIVEAELNHGNIGYIYERYEKDDENGKIYVGKTIRSVSERHTEHSNKLDAVCSIMKNPLIKEISKVYGSHKTILNYETMYIKHYRDLYKDRLINNYHNKEDKRTFIAELPIKVMPVLPKLYSGIDRYRLKMNGKDVFERKYGKDKTKSLEKMMLYIEENYKDGCLKMF